MRQFIRHPSTIPIHYQLQEVVGDSKEYLRNISEGGSVSSRTQRLNSV
ncbi:hypothetical protein [endosymbiont of Riftia pachyptila]|uniref:Uncharacterized protein n=1 Tax=endosymbiont of Riftia pachyptila (vent Ph05) TaxID=1048808 RepID=G2DF20_9GAMM|nr:hypothetical protein [endosymbiont of Riftia pachyptila]EGV50793.1 hypothetical protein Rifp1Sym_cj00170 [endosymbiont of Riftia pachyptila (vent Ph05)]